MASCPCLDESQLRKLKSQYETQNARTAASQIQALVDGVNTLKIQVGVLGERGAGVSTLVEALVDKPRRVADPRAYFREAPPATVHAVGRAHPVYPDLVLHDMPGFEVCEKPAAYLKRLGDLSRFGCLVVVVGSAGLRDGHLQLLKAAKQKGKKFLLARTKVDLDLHTAERRLRARYNASEQTELIRKELAGKLAKDGLEAKNVFLVSGLETDKYEFALFEDSLEEEVLNLKRSHDRSLEDLKKAISPKKINALYEICQSGSLSEVPAVIQHILADPTQVQLDVAVIGEAGSGKSSLVNALRGVDSGDPDAAPTGAIEVTQRAKAYVLPAVPNLYLWDLPGLGLTEEDVRRLDLSRYDSFLLVASERYRHAHSCLARAINGAGKQVFFVRSKIDVDVEARPRGPPAPKDDLRKQVRQSCEEALKKDGIEAPQVFLVSSLNGEGDDLPCLKDTLRRDAPDLKRVALRRALPLILSRLVRRKARVLMADVWNKALQICLSCVENPFKAFKDASDNLIATIASLCVNFGLDEPSLEAMAQAAGKTAPLLQAQIRSTFAKPLSSSYVLGLITKPLSLTSWAWSYVPYFGQSTKPEPEISFALTYGILKQAVVELSEDAERVLLMALAEE
uniref:IRG-type G domain-containing protein n=1 Tax=Salvator merianae TaxID=96440 RepID=A0A8D0BDY3_SALMN